jgi:hypothetical protein
MNPSLLPVYEQTVGLMREDPRVLAAYMSGSVGTPREDAYSDVDPVFVIAADVFDDVDGDLRDLFQRAGVEPILMWPERTNGPTARNYAVFFHVDGELVQYDINIVALPPGERRAVPRGQIVFDKAGALEPTDDPPASADAASRLVWRIEMYWIYVYILKKYLLRGDPFRIAAAQRELFHAHLAVLRALAPETPDEWWPTLAAQVARGHVRDVLLSYLNDGAAAGTRRRLPGQLEQFSRDARAACIRRGRAYPEAFEKAVRETVASLLTDND